jgi:peptide/nickel transport system permease protein
MSEKALPAPRYAGGETKAPPRPQQRRRNWTLWIGAVLVAVVVVVMLFGPLLAPADPMQENYIVQFGDRFRPPPFPPGTEGYPLGSDEWGRDILSRLLWAVRPTMTMVLVAAALRLSLGIFIGLVSGWSNGRLGRLMDTGISAALAIPVFFIALCLIAAFASRWGIWAFVLGLAVTGWAEAARLVYQQTHLIKSQPFVEATRALGGSGGQIILSHVIPHIMPLMWIQLAFEVSTTLLTAAALGFVGYYVNAIWIPISDFVGLRTSGTPELGQMLGVAVGQHPWTAVFAGSAVFFIVLAFNLFGEGLRIQLSPERRRRRVESTQGLDRAGSWIEERVYYAVSRWQRNAAANGAFALLFVVILGGGWILWRSQSSKLAPTQIEVPGGHTWPAELHDAQGTYWTTARGPLDPNPVWTYQAPAPLIGGPVVDREGNLYLTGEDRMVYSVDSGGQERWRVQLPLQPVGWPALTPDGNVVIADTGGNLTLLNWEGILLWEYLCDPPDAGLSSPIVGPQGTIYVTVQNFIVAVTPQGERLWQIRIPTYSYSSPLPRLSADGELLFFEDTVVDADSGVTQFQSTTGPTDRYMVGSNGKIYMRTIDTFMEWQTTETGAVMIQRAKIETRLLNSTQRFPFDTGISPNDNPWLLFSSPYEYARLVWTDPDGQASQVTDFPYRLSRLIGIDADGLGYLCGVMDNEEGTECRAVYLNSSVVAWKTLIDTYAPPVGGALVDGRLYVVTADGKLSAFGQ